MKPNYILDDKKNPVEASIREWAIWFNNPQNCRVALDKLPNDTGKVSTVFLGFDHGYCDGPPVLFETMVFRMNDDWPNNKYQRRYCTWDEAVAGHAEILKATLAEEQL